MRDTQPKGFVSRNIVLCERENVLFGKVFPRVKITPAIWKCMSSLYRTRTNTPSPLFFFVPYTLTLLKLKLNIKNKKTGGGEREGKK